MYLFAIIKQQKFTVRFNTLKQNNPKNKLLINNHQQKNL